MKKKSGDNLIDNKAQNSTQGNASSIKFRRKKIKSNVKFGGKIVAFLILAGISGALFSNIIMNIRYSDIMHKSKLIERNDNITINDYRKIINIISPSLVTVSGDEESLTERVHSEGNVTGIILDSSGNILTSYSKIKDMNQIYVKLSSKGVMPIKARVIIGDDDMDIAIIKIEYDGELKPIKFANLESAEEGQKIAILSNSIGDDYIGNIVPGMITSTKSSIKVKDSETRYDLIEVNAPINRENNSGVVCNFKGEVLGIASEKISNEKSLNGIYYAIKINELENIINSTNVFKSVLGITGGVIIPKNDNEVSGFYVENVIKGGNASKSGIKPTDIIFKVDDKDIKSTDDIEVVLQNKKKGDTLRCKVKRNGRVDDINIVLE